MFLSEIIPHRVVVGAIGAGAVAGTLLCAVRVLDCRGDSGAGSDGDSGDLRRRGALRCGPRRRVRERRRAHFGERVYQRCRYGQQLCPTAGAPTRRCRGTFRPRRHHPRRRG